MKGIRFIDRCRLQSLRAFLCFSLVSVLLVGCVKPDEPELSQEEVSPPTETTFSQEKIPLPTQSAQTLSRLEIQPLGSPLMAGDTRKLSATVRNAEGQVTGTPTVTWISENPSTVDVNPEGILTAIAPGTTTITASNGDLEGSTQVKVIKTPLAKLEIQPSLIAMTTGKQKKISVIATDIKNQVVPATGITWESKNPSILTTGRDGLLTAVGPGSTTILAKLENQVASAKVTVSKPGLAKLQVKPEKISGVVGDKIQFKAIIVDTEGNEHPEPSILWKSGGIAVSTISNRGLASLKRAGTVTVIASGKGQVATAVLTVSQPPIMSIEILPPAATILVNKTKQFETIIKDANDQIRKNVRVHWTTSDPSIVTVSPTGVFTARAAGSALVTASIGKVKGKPVSILVKAQPKRKKLTRKEIMEKYKGQDPSKLVLLSGITGEIAGTGDPTKRAGAADRAGLADHPLALELSDLPKDRYGLIDWADAIKQKKVNPLGSLNPKAKPSAPLDMDVTIYTKSQFQPDVIFPHYVHTLWLTCANCHPGIFPMNAKQANKMMTMPQITAGEFCGRCHNRVAFPLSDCLRCHVKPKDMPPIDPNYKAQIKPRTP